MMQHYDYLIVGSGLYGSTFAYKAKQAGKTCLVIDKRSHAGGNVYCEKVEGINVHKYGAHIFHTNNKSVWDFVNSIVEFNRYTNCPIANFKGELYNLPFNMNTFYRMWGVTTPTEAVAKLEEQRAEARRRLADLSVSEPRNLEEQAQLLVGKDIYEILIKEYTEKQWGRKCTELPAFIIRRLPVRLIYDNNYFNDKYQGIPIGGYNKLIEGLLAGVEVRLNTNFFAKKEVLMAIADRIVYTGAIDEYFDYYYGKLEYRTVSFDMTVENCTNYQGNAVINYNEAKYPFTRIIEHKHFELGKQPSTIITKEYPQKYTPSDEPYYPINDEKNLKCFNKYKALAEKNSHVIFGGRLGQYAYFDMDDTIASAISLTQKELSI